MDSLIHTADLSDFQLKAKKARLVIISNREPFSITVNDQTVQLEKTPGGLVSALDPVLRENGGLWICWEGATRRVEAFDDTPSYQDLLALNQELLPYEIRTVSLTESEINHYYYGYANTRLWPLCHYFPSLCNFLDERDWPSYYSANQKFAEVALKETTEDDLLWVQDYHLMLVPSMIRRVSRNRKIAFFCHIPFPDYQVFRLLPSRKAILQGMLGSDLIGFHIPEYVRHFLECVDQLFFEDEGITVNFEEQTILYQNRLIQVKAFPISIDYAQIDTLANSASIQEQAQLIQCSYNMEFIGIGVDRLDYTKGILERLEAIRFFFEKYPQYRQRLTFVQIASPTRTEVEAYRLLKEQVEQAVGSINGQLAEGNWSPIQYFYRSMSLEEIIPYFLISDFALVTPLRDGMNLVAKEYCAAKCDNSGELILSEFTGASYELKEAYIVNPYNIEQVADSIYMSLQLPKAFKAQKMFKLRQYISQNDIHHWVQCFLTAFQSATST
jgi:alpha,alpha-trehalose-phosphate synthase [UDP-forming]